MLFLHLLVFLIICSNVPSLVLETKRDTVTYVLQFSTKLQEQEGTLI